MDTQELLENVQSDHLQILTRSNQRDSYFSQDPIQRACFLCSCNGGLLFLNSSDPSTRKHKVIPKPPLIISIFGTMYGFGYDSEKDDYKSENETRMYSSWKRMKDFPYSLSQYAKVFGGVHLHGTIHSLVDNCCMIVVTDLVEETYLSMQLPDFRYKSMTGMSLVFVLRGGGVIGTPLCLQALYDLWFMKEYGNYRKSWTKFVCFDLEGKKRDDLLLSMGCSEMASSNHDWKCGSVFRCYTTFKDDETDNRIESGMENFVDTVTDYCFCKAFSS